MLEKQILPEYLNSVHNRTFGIKDEISRIQASYITNQG